MVGMPAAEWLVHQQEPFQRSLSGLKGAWRVENERPTAPIIHQLQKSHQHENITPGRGVCRSAEIAFLKHQGKNVINKGDQAMDVASFREICKFSSLTMMSSPKST